MISIRLLTVHCTNSDASLLCISLSRRCLCICSFDWCRARDACFVVPSEPERKKVSPSLRCISQPVLFNVLRISARCRTAYIKLLSYSLLCVICHLQAWVDILCETGGPEKRERIMKRKACRVSAHHFSPQDLKKSAKPGGRRTLRHGCLPVSYRVSPAEQRDAVVLPPPTVTELQEQVLAKVLQQTHTPRIIYLWFDSDTSFAL
jgi:hypothetical protein